MLELSWPSPLVGGYGHLFIETIEQGDNIKYFEFLKNARLF